MNSKIYEKKRKTVFSAVNPIRIYLPENPGEVATYAAGQLCGYLKKSTGSECLVDSGRAACEIIFELKEDVNLGDDGFRIHEKDGSVIISGSPNGGCLYGAYEFLERFIGVRWYTSDTEKVPHRDKIEIPTGFDFISKPDFLMRSPFWKDVITHPDFSSHLRANANSALEAKHGGQPYRFGKGVWACHTFQTLMPPSKYFKDHPEYYGERDGKRSSENQPCLSNPEVLKIMTEAIKDRIRNDPGAKFYGVSQDDHQRYCQCPKCAAIDAEEGSHAGTVVRFVNAVAEEIEKEFPGVIIETLAYQYSRFPTQKTRLRHNVVPCICTIECGFAPFSIPDSPFKANRQFVDCLKGWAKQTDELYIWDYVTNFRNYYHFFANIDVLQDNLKFFRDNHVKYMFEQGDTQGDYGFMAELKAWLLAKWMWNADLPYDDLVKDFTDGYYGAGGKYVRKFLKLLSERMLEFHKENNGWESGIYVDAAKPDQGLSEFPVSFFKKAEKLWLQAEEATRNDPIAHRAVRRGMLSVDYERFVREPNAENASRLQATAEEVGGYRWSEGGVHEHEIQMMIDSLRGKNAPYQKEGYELFWHDEFECPELNGNNWQSKGQWIPEVGFIRNNELQYYTRWRKENCRIENSCLVIEARKEDYTDPDTGKTAKYTSASLKSQINFTFRYGRVEVRAKVPSGPGVWPAAWSLGANFPEVSWPKCGEIDIMEFVGFKPKRCWGTAHWFDRRSTKEDNHMSSGGHIDLEKPLSNDFHVYAAEWSEYGIEFFIDDRKYHEVKFDGMEPDPDNWHPFRQYHYLILNLAYGGAWGGELGVDDSCLPAKYLIDWVRVYRKPTADGEFRVQGSEFKGKSQDLNGKQTADQQSPEMTSGALLNTFESTESIESIDTYDTRTSSRKSKSKNKAQPSFIASAEEISHGDFSATEFTRNIINGKTIRKATARVTGLGIFDFYVNGTVVGNDFLKPGFTSADKRHYAFTYDITSLMKTAPADENVFAATVTTGWWRDVIVRGANPGPREAALKNAFWAEIEIEDVEGRKTRFVTDASWRAKNIGPVISASIYGGEKYDARINPYWRFLGEPEWKSAVVYEEFKGVINDSHGAEVTLREDLAMKPASGYIWKGVKNVIVNHEYGTVIKLREITPSEAICLDQGEELIVDFGQNAAAVPRFTAKASSGTEITLIGAEMLNDGNGAVKRGCDGPEGSLYRANYRYCHDCNNAAVYVFGGNDYETWNPRFTFFGYRYMSVKATAPVTITLLESIPVTSVKKELERSTIVTGNADVNKLISNIRWGHYSNYLSIPTDCPQRDERQGWSGDTQVFSAAALYNADVYDFLRKWTQDLRDGANPKGFYPNVAPNNWGLPERNDFGWADAGVIVPWTAWHMTGDRKIIDENWDAMTRFLTAMTADNAVFPGTWTFSDWLAFEKWESCSAKCLEYNDGKGDCRPYLGAKRMWDFLYGCYWLMDARLMAEMAEATGRDTAEWNAMADRAAIRLKRDFFEADGGLPKDIRDMQTPTLFALKLGLYRDEVKDAAIKGMVKIFEDNGNCLKTGFLGTSILMDTLTYSANRPDLAYTLLLQHNFPSWLYSVDQGATTIWERWNSYTKKDGFGPVNMNSFNHYAYGAVLAWMYGTMAGIRPGPKGGFDVEFVLAPIPDERLGSAEATFRTKNGTIRSAWHYENGKIHYEFTVPKGATATLLLPDGHKECLKEGNYSIFRKRC